MWDYSRIIMLNHILFFTIILLIVIKPAPSKKLETEDFFSRNNTTDEETVKKLEEVIKDLEIVDRLTAQNETTRDSRALVNRLSFLAGLKTGGIISTSGSLSASNSIRVFGKVMNTALSVSYGHAGELDPLPLVEQFGPASRPMGQNSPLQTANREKPPQTIVHQSPTPTMHHATPVTSQPKANVTHSTPQAFQAQQNKTLSSPKPLPHHIPQVTEHFADEADLRRGRLPSLYNIRKNFINNHNALVSRINHKFLSSGSLRREY